MSMPGSFEARLSVLPPDLQQLLSDMPQETASALLDKMLQAAALSFRALTEADVLVIKVRLHGNGIFVIHCRCME